MIPTRNILKRYPSYSDDNYSLVPENQFILDASNWIVWNQDTQISSPFRKLPLLGFKIY